MRALSFLSAAAAPHYQAVTGVVAQALGVATPPLEAGPLADLRQVTTSPGPTLAFLCGMPFVLERDAGSAVEAIAAPVPRSSPGPVYYADLLVRPDAPADRASWRVGFNGRDSLSGWELPRHGLRAAGDDPDSIDWIETGSHHRSLELLLAGEIDAAPIDSTVLDLESSLDRRIGRLQRLARYGPMPVPPVVLIGASPRVRDTIRTAILRLSPHVLALGRVERYVPVTATDYQPVRVLLRARG